MEHIDKQLITGLILAGGRGTRMGQVDKGLQTFRNAPMALHVLMRLSPQVGQLLINANQNIAVYESFGIPVWPDHTEGFAGPLAGLQTGLMHCESPYLLTAPCDSPFLPEDLAQKLSDALMNENADIAVAATRETENDVSYTQRHPVFALVKSTLLPSLNSFLHQGGRKIDSWFKEACVAEVIFEDNMAFRNINTVQELRQLES